MNEPTITVNGVTLTEAEAISVRVAVSSFLGEMQGPNPLGNDAHGIFMAAAYTRTLTEVERLMLNRW
jgi:hypothetical protein